MTRRLGILALMVSGAVVACSPLGAGRPTGTQDRVGAENAEPSSSTEVTASEPAAPPPSYCERIVGLGCPVYDNVGECEADVLSRTTELWENYGCGAESEALMRCVAAHGAECPGAGAAELTLSPLCGEQGRQLEQCMGVNDACVAYQVLELDGRWINRIECEGYSAHCEAKRCACDAASPPSTSFAWDPTADSGGSLADVARAACAR